MSVPNESPIRQEAARWFQHRIAGDCSAEDEARFAAWLRADAAHAGEYRALEKLWTRLGELPLAAEPASAAIVRRGFPLRWAASAAFAAVAAVTVLLGYRWYVVQPVFTASYATHAAERARADLPDGSKIELSAQSRLRVVFYRDRRESTLESGEAYFTVARDVGQPFRVHAGKTSVRVTGTRFSVRLVDDAAFIALEEGAVEVSAPGAALANLVAPAALESNANGLKPLAAADVERITGWRRGQLIFHDEPLAAVVRELSRYRHAAVAVADAEVGSLKVTGIAFVDRPDTFIEGLATVLPVVVERSADGTVILRGAPLR